MVEVQYNREPTKKYKAPQKCEVDRQADSTKREALSKHESNC